MTSGVAQTQSDSAVMAQTAAKFDHVNESLQSMLSTLMTELSTLNSTWRGLNAPGSPFDGMLIYQRRFDRRPIVLVQESSHDPLDDGHRLHLREHRDVV